ncbi:Uncharacterized protein SCF082_LOCUS47616, partial [Durusdinium trenchii]
WAEEVAAATFKQIENKIEGDLQALTEHVTFVQAHANRQGSLDMKYLSTRYERGVKKVEELMTDHQRYVHCASLADALPDFMRSLNEKPMTD